MSDFNDLAMSRPLGVAEALRGDALDADAVLRLPVLLTGEAEALSTQNGRWCFVNALRLLPRIAGQVTVAIPPGLDEFERTIRALAASVYAQRSITVIAGPTAEKLSDFAAILNIGSTVRAGLPWTAVNSNGWVARVSSTEGPLPADMDEPNPVAALMAASIGATEVFKRIYGIPPEKGPLLGLSEFSLYDLGANPKDLGPPFPRGLTLPDTVIVGAGAIGNGIALLLADTDWGGRVCLIDNQKYAKENLGTCVLLDSNLWLGEDKATQLAEWLRANSSLAAVGEVGPIEHARSAEQVRSMTVELVLNGLDDVQARHDTQMLWPTTLVDGGINAAGAAVVTHRLDQPGAACLRCAFELPRTDVRAQQRAASGLSDEALEDLSQPLTDRDIEQADAEKRPWLREMKAAGKTRCATVGEATSAQLGLKLAEGFRPSVPFIATAAAALVMTEAVKALCYSDAPFTHRFQIESLFWGPQASIGTIRPAAPNCICVTGRDIIDAQVQKRRKPA